MNRKRFMMRPRFVLKRRLPGACLFVVACSAVVMLNAALSADLPKGRGEREATVGTVDRGSRLFIDGKPVSPLLYYQGIWGSSDGAIPIRLSTQWRRFEVPIGLPASGIPKEGISSSLQISVGGESGTVWIDDISLIERGKPQENLIDNGECSGDMSRSPCEFFVKGDAKPARATAEMDGGVMRIQVESGGSELWHVHLLTKGTYVLSRGIPMCIP